MPNLHISHKDDRITYLGRFLHLDDKTMFNYSACGFQFSCVAKKIDIEVEIEVNEDMWAHDNLYPWIEVSIQGDSAKEFALELTEGKAWYTLFESETMQSLDIVVRKRTEPRFSHTALCQIRIDGTQIKPLEQTGNHRICFLGDSLTCGYGILDADGGMEFKTKHEDVFATYAAQLAKKFNADFDILAVSGIGFYSCNTDEDIIIDKRLMKHIFDYSDYLSEMKLYNKAVTKWDFTRFTPDLVSICLGANDQTYLQYESEEKNVAAIESYKALLKQVRKVYSAPILCFAGDYYTHVTKVIESAIKQYKEESKDDNIKLFKLTEPKAHEGIGTLSHPYVSTHTRWAEDIAPFIRSWLDWE